MKNAPPCGRQMRNSSAILSSRGNHPRTFTRCCPCGLPHSTTGQMQSLPATVNAAWQSWRGPVWHLRSCSSSSGCTRSSSMSSIKYLSYVARRRPKAAARWKNDTKQPTKSMGCPQYRKRAADALQLFGEAYTAAKQAQLCILRCNSDENPTRRLDVAVQVEKSAFIAAEG